MQFKSLMLIFLLYFSCGLEVDKLDPDLLPLSCTNGATNPPACDTCPTGQIIYEGVCRAPCDNGAINPPACDEFPPCTNGATNPPACDTCPAGKTMVGTECVDDCTNGAINPPSCDQCQAPQTWDGEKCVSPTPDTSGAAYYVGSDAVATYGTNCSTPSVNPTCGFPSIAALSNEIKSRTPKTGSDIYFKRGETFTFTSTNRNFAMEHGGSFDDYAIVGAYGTGARPIIDAEWTFPGTSATSLGEDACQTSKDCWTPIFRVSGLDYIRLENLDFRNIIGIGPSFNENKITGETSDNIIVDNIRVDKAWGNNFSFSSGSNCLVENSEFSQAALGFMAWDKTGSYGRRGGVVFSSNASNIVFRYNYVHNQYGEALDVITGTTNFVITQNRFEDNRAIGPYIGTAKGGKVTYNLLIRTKTEYPYPGKRYSGMGVIGEEEARKPGYHPGDTLVMGNVFIGNHKVGIELGSANPNYHSYRNVRIVNNTIIGAQYAFRWAKSAGSTYSGTAISNGTATTIIDKGLIMSDTSTDIYTDQYIIYFTSGSNKGQQKLVTAFKKSTGELTWSGALAETRSGDTFTLKPDYTGTVISGNIVNYTVEPQMNVNTMNAASNWGAKHLGNHWSDEDGLTDSEYTAKIPASSRHHDDRWGTNPTVTSVVESKNFDLLEALISDAKLPNGSTAINSGIDNSAYGTQLFYPSSGDPEDATFSTISQWDFGAVDFVLEK